MKSHLKMLLIVSVLVLAGVALVAARHAHQSPVAHTADVTDSPPSISFSTVENPEYQKRIARALSHRPYAFAVASSGFGPPGPGNFIPDPPKPSLTEISCRVNRLTDIVFPEKILKVIIGDPRAGDFKLVGTKVGSENHLIIEPLKKGVISDLFIYGADRVSYLLVRTVPDGQKYDFSVQSLLSGLVTETKAKGNRTVLNP